MPGADFTRFFQRRLAKGAGFQRMLLALVDVIRGFAVFAGMPLFTAGLPLPLLFLVQLQIDRDSAGGGQG